MLRVLVIACASVMLGGVALIAYIGMQGGGGQDAPHPTVSLLAAGHPVRAGELLQPGDLTAVEVAAADAPPGAHADSTEARSALVGAMVRRTLGEHQVLGSDDVLRPGDRGFLAAVLQPGTRAVSVAVDAVSGEAGLIWPGDRVDLILTQTIDTADQSPAHRVAGETVLGDVRVIAVDQQLVQGGQAGTLLDGRAPASRTITLEVTPQNAARIAVATRLGKLQVVLRAADPASPPPPDTASAIPLAIPASLAAGDRPGPASPTPTGPAPASPAPGGSTVWGGDVSHALGQDRTVRNPEVRLFQGTRPVEAYKF